MKLLNMLPVPMMFATLGVLIGGGIGAWASDVGFVYGLGLCLGCGGFMIGLGLIKNLGGK